MSRIQTVLSVSDSSQVGEARRAAAQLAERAGLGETDRGKVAIVVTELGNNLARHTHGGQLLIGGVGGPGGGGVEVLSIDRGPGMADVGKCMRDGYSTGGTPGTGLGAVRRLSSTFDVYSTAPGGTVIMSRVTAGSNGVNGADFEWGVVCVPAPGETACGDTWRATCGSGRLSLMLADGLGHGPLAAEAAEAAGAAYESDPFAAPAAVLDVAHLRMQGTRGGSVAAARIEGATARFAGVGNIAGSIVSPAGSRGLMSHNGTAGVRVRKVQELEYPWPPDGVLVMHSDGLQTRWSLATYPGAAQRHPAVVAGILYRDFARGRDDLTVAVVRPSNRHR